MRRYEDPGMNLTIELNKKDYKVMCIYSYNRKEDNYSITLMLIRRDVEDPHYIDSQTIKSSKEKIREDICKLIESAEYVGFFDKYIERQNYFLKCFDIGNTAIDMANHY